jgi:hypothetical protein
MSIMGWGVLASLLVYKTMIRPLFEYGLALCILPTNIQSQLQSLQNEVLRYIFGVHTSTSIVAMHTLARLDFIAVRNQHLNVRFVLRLCAGLASNDAVSMVLSRQATGLRPVAGSSKVPSLWTSFISKSHWRSSFSVSVPATFGLPSGPQLLEYRIRQLDRSRASKSGSIASALSPVKSLHSLFLLRSAAAFPPADFRTLVNWLLGRKVSYGQCLLCGAVPTRIHLVQCSGFEDVFVNHFVSLGWSRDPVLASLSVLDELLFRYFSLPDRLQDITFLLSLAKDVQLMSQCLRRVVAVAAILAD